MIVHGLFKFVQNIKLSFLFAELQAISEKRCFSYRWFYHFVAMELQVGLRNLRAMVVLPLL